MRASECDALYAFRERQQGNGSRCLQAVDADLLAAADEQQDLPVVGEQAGARLLCSRKDRAECVVEASAESAREQQDGRRLLGSAREGELRICEIFFWRVAFRDSGVGCAPGPVFRCRAVGIAEEDIRQGRCVAAGINAVVDGPELRCRRLFQQCLQPIRGGGSAAEHEQTAGFWQWAVEIHLHLRQIEFFFRHGTRSSLGFSGSSCRRFSAWRSML